MDGGKALLNSVFYLFFFLGTGRHSLHSEFYYIHATVVMLILPGTRLLYTRVHSKTSTANACSLLRNKVYRIYTIYLPSPSLLCKWRVSLFKFSIFYKITSEWEEIRIGRIKMQYISSFWFFFSINMISGL